MSKSPQARESIATTQLPALKRGEDKPRKGKGKKQKLHPWYNQFTEGQPETLREAYDALVAGIEAADPDSAAAAVHVLGQLIDRQEGVLRESEERADYALGLFTVANDENVRLRDLAEHYGYGDRIEGAPPLMSGGITHTPNRGGSLLAAMGIEEL